MRAYFWIHSCGGHSKVVKNASLRIWMLELLYDKYCAPFDISRVTLFYTLFRSIFMGVGALDYPDAWWKQTLKSVIRTLHLGDHITVSMWTS